MSKKLVSVILPTYNCEKTLSKSIASVRFQTYNNWELIIVNDGSNDNVTEDIIKKNIALDSRIIYIKNEKNLGIQKSLNIGLSISRGEYIARIDDDDEWINKEKLSKQVEFLEKNNEYGLVGTGAIVVNENDKELFRYTNPIDDYKIRSKILRKNCFIHSSVLYRKDIAMSFGGYDESTETKHVEDYDFWLKFGTKSKFKNFNTYDVKFMIREKSISNKNKIIQFSRNLYLISKYKNFYPNYIFSLIYGYLRIFIYKVIILCGSKRILILLQKFYKN